MKKFLVSFFLVSLFCIAIGNTSVFAQDYFVSNSGNDKDAGTSESTPWKTISKINTFAFKPEDVIHFKSGDVWREQLVPYSGNESGEITYTSYGSGEKPLLLGSQDRSNMKDWEYTANNIWTLKSAPEVVSNQILKPGSIEIWSEENAVTNEKIINDSENGETLKIDCLNSGEKSNHIQLIIKDIKIQGGNKYRLSFKAKSSVAFKIDRISLMKMSSPWTQYTSGNSDLSPEISTVWKDYEIIYLASASDENARLTIYLGNSMPDGSELLLGSLNFSEIQNAALYNDVGNIIFDNGKEIGRKVFSENELNVQNEFWYDEVNKTLKLYSNKNPAELYNSIECAISKCIIDENHKYYVKYEGLALKYGGSHGIGGGNVHHITVKDCDISYIGGAKMMYKGSPVRYGNGIEFWNDAHDNLVEGCNIWEIYDAAVTNQGDGVDNQQYNITYSKNKIWNAEYSFEYWNSNEKGMTSNIVFENNYCKNAGGGWGHSQRPDKNGSHISFHRNTAVTKGIYVRNNVFDGAELCSIYVSDIWNGIASLVIDNNTYVQNQGELIAIWMKTNYYTYNFNSFRNEIDNGASPKLLADTNSDMTLALND